MSLPNKLWLGYSNEQNSRVLTLDISALLAKFPEAEAQLLVMKSESRITYIAETETDGANLLWPITAYDLAGQKNGFAQVVLTTTNGDDEDVILASEKIPVSVEEGIDSISVTELPSPQASYLTQILAAAARAEAAAASLSITVSGTTLVIGGESG